MKIKNIKRTLAPLSLGVILLLSLWFSLRPAGADLNPDEILISVEGLNRPEDPVVVPGADLSGFIGQPIDELVVYAYDANSWSPIPFQIDERSDDITGTYVIFEDGLLDDNDELVFMAKDVGQDAGQEWVDNEESKLFPRHLITATDPLNPGDTGWAYLYRSTTLPTSSEEYVDWNETLQTITALSYTAAFDPDNFFGLADLTVNGNGIDILDRQKTRVTAFILNLNEEDLISFYTPTVSIPVVGPVRGVSNGGGFNMSIYGARFQFSVSFDTSGFPISIDDVRTSFDLNDPAVTGISNYWDSNGTSATIDGSPDSVPSSPRMNWYQASGTAGGLVMAMPTVSVGGGTVTNYYKDNDTFDPADTGDNLSYGDTGLFVDNPSGLIEMNLAATILPPNTLNNVGATYYDRVLNPITATTSVQLFGVYIEPLYLPVVLGS